MKTLTIFTPTYNRAHTLIRTYKSLCSQTCKDFEWLIVDDGSTDNTAEIIKQWITEANFCIRYICKENGGLYTGYNTAYANIETELNVCIDSDDYMPENAVELIINHWRKHGNDKYAGIIGLDYYHHNNTPIGGKFPNELKSVYYLDLYTKNIHHGDIKLVFRTDLMKRVSPLIGFPNEKNFNPVSMHLLVCDEYPLLVLNHNLCFVEYQANDSMSKAIYFQYRNSPKSFTKQRLIELSLKRNTFLNKFRISIHYISSCIFAKDKKWLHKSPCKIYTILAIPLGILLNLLIRYKTRK